MAGMRKAGKSVGIFVAAVFLAALTSQSAVAQTIKIVSSLPRTGSANTQTTSIVNGMKMAVDEANGQVGSMKIVFEDWDDASPERGAWDPAIEAGNADKAINDPDVMVYLGTYNSGAAKISMPKLNQAGLVMISPANTWPGLTKPGVGEPNEPRVYRPSGKVTFFRVVPADDIQGLVAAKWAKELGAKKVYVTHDGELYGKGIATMFKKAAGPIGLDIVGFDQIETKAANYKALAVKIKQSRAEIVYFGGTTQTNAGQLAKDLVAAGVQAKLMVPDGCFENAFLEAAGKDALDDRTYVTFGGVPGDKLTGKGAEFYESYRKKYGAEPEGYATYGYEAAKVAIEAIRKAGKKDRAAILAAVAATKDYDGALGHWSFDANGDTTLRTMSGNTVKNGKFEFVKLLD